MPKPEINFDSLDNLPNRRPSGYFLSKKSLVDTYGGILYYPFVLSLIFFFYVGSWGYVWIYLFITLIAAALVMNYWSKKDKEIKNASKYLNDFALKNNFIFKEENKEINEKGSLFKYGSKKIEQRIVEGKFSDYPFKLSDYRYEADSQRTHRTYEIRVMRVELPRKLPHMVIDCIVEEGESGLASNSNASTLPIYFDESQRIDLEGDFYKYFRVYAPDDHEVPALSVIAPDVMDSLLRIKALCDIEIIENYIYFYWPDETLSKQNYEYVFETVNKVIDSIGQKLSRGNIFTSKEQAHINSKSPAKLIRPAWRTKDTLILGLLALFLIPLAIFAALAEMGVISDELPKEWHPYIFIPLVGFLIFVTVYSLIKENKNKKLRTELKRRYNRLD